MSVRYAILGLLAQRPRHGYELRAAFEAVIGGEQNWDVKPAQIYTTLSRLEDTGLVRQEGIGQDSGPEKRIYAITITGRQELDGWFSDSVAAEHQRDEFFVKFMLGLALSQENGQKTPEADPYKIIQTQRARLYQDLHDVTAQRSQVDPKTGLAQILLFDKSIMHLEADLRWLDMIESRLDDIRKQPVPEPEARRRGRPKKA